MSEMDSILLPILHIRCKSWLYIAVECVMEERENKEKRRENEQKAISTVSQATDTHTDKKTYRNTPQATDD